MIKYASARHVTYARKLFDKMLRPEMVADCLRELRDGGGLFNRLDLGVSLSRSVALLQKIEASTRFCVSTRDGGGLYKRVEKWKLIV